MKHFKHRLQGLGRQGYTCHVLSQKSGLIDFRRLYTSHEGDPRSQTAAALVSARREIRAEVARFEAVIESERQHIKRVRGWMQNNQKGPNTRK